MRLRAPLNRRDSYRPPPDALEVYWRGFQEVGGVQEGALWRVQRGKGRGESLHATGVQHKTCITMHILNMCLLHYAFIYLFKFIISLLSHFLSI